MKMNNVKQIGNDVQDVTGFKNICRASCGKVLARIAGVKEAIFHESVEALRTQRHLLRLALNEAEAVARQTLYPDLVFPALAAEKVQAVIAWNARRRAVQRAKYAFWAAGQAGNQNYHQSRIKL